MSEKKARVEAPEAEVKPVKVVKPGEELVDYMAPLLPGGTKKDILVGVNGEIIRIKRGVPVKIKRKFLIVLKNASAQEYAAYEAMAQLQAQSNVPAAKL